MPKRAHLILTLTENLIHCNWLPALKCMGWGAHCLRTESTLPGLSLRLATHGDFCIGSFTEDHLMAFSRKQLMEADYPHYAVSDWKQNTMRWRCFRFFSRWASSTRPPTLSSSALFQAISMTTRRTRRSTLTLFTVGPLLARTLAESEKETTRMVSTQTNDI